MASHSTSPTGTRPASGTHGARTLSLWGPVFLVVPPGSFVARRGRTPLVLLLTLLLVVVSAPPFARASTGVTFTGGGVVVDGVRYARQANLLTLSVTTASGTDCVRVAHGGSTLEQVTTGSTQSQTSWTFEFQALDGNGTQSVTATAYTNRGCNQNPSSSATSYVRDNTAPTLTGALQATNLGANGWYVGDATVSWTCTDNTGGSGIAAGACPANTTVGGEGDTLSASATITDRVGNPASTTVTPIRIDRTAPTTTATAPAGWSASDAQVHLSATDNLSGMAATSYQVDTGSGFGAVQPYSSALTFSDEGEYEVRYWSVDVAGNQEVAKTVTVRIDKTSPTVSANQTPAKNGAGWNNSAVTVTFTCADTLSGIASCTAPQPVAAEVRDHPVVGTAVDNAGHQNEATHLISIDWTRPEITTQVTGQAGNAGWYLGPVTVDFACHDPRSDDVASGIVAESCPASQTLSVDGSNLSTTPVTVTDAADNVSDPATVVNGIHIDQTKPVTTTHGVPTSWVNTAPQITLTADDGTIGSGIAHTFFQLDSGPVQTYDSAFTVDAEGQTTVTYWSVDVAANFEAARSADVLIDRIAPVTTTAGFVDGAWTNAAVTVELVAQDGPGSGVASTWYQLGDGSATEYAEAFALGHGVHDLRYWSVDDVGNVEDAGTATIKVDLVAPTLTGAPTADNLGGDGWYTDDITVVWTCSDDDSGIDGACPAPSTVTGEGNALSVSASVSDVAGNPTTTLVGDLKIDRTPPVTSSTTPSGWQTGPFTVELTATDALSGVASTRYQIDDGALQAYTAPIAFPDDGTYELSYWSVDRAGNHEDATSVTVQVDRTAPEISSSQEPPANAAGWNNENVTVSFTCTDVTSGIASCTDPVPVTTEVKDHPVAGEAVDHAGNSTSITHPLSIDWTTPIVTATASGTLGNAGWYVSAVTVDHTCVDPVSNAVASGIPTDACPGSQSLSDDGSDLASTPVTVVDAAGNVSTAAQATGIRIDTRRPDTTAPGLPGGWTDAPVEVTLSATDHGGSGIAATHYAVNDGVPVPYTVPFTLTDEGVYALTFWSVDVAGNVEAPGTAVVRIDRTAPVTSAEGLPGGWTNAPVEVTLSATDLGGSEVAVTRYTINDGDAIAYAGPFTLADQGVYALTFWSVDHAGNIEGVNSATVQVDLTPPATTDDAPTGWQLAPVTVTLTPTDAGGSGLTDTRYSFDGGTTSQPYGEPFLVAAEGTTTLTYWSVDVAGNVETPRTAVIRIDLTDPSVGITSPANGSTTTAATVDVTGVVTDDHSGVASVTVQGTETTVVNGTFTRSGIALDCGTNAITAMATDAAGRSTSASATVTRACAEVTSIHQPLRPSKAGEVHLNDVKRGRVVPVKVEVSYLQQPYLGSNAHVGNPTISLRELPSCAASDASGTSLEDSAGNANADDQFRWSSNDGVWVYNLATDKATVGNCYRIDMFVAGQRASTGQWAVLRMQR